MLLHYIDSNSVLFYDYFLVGLTILFRFLVRYFSVLNYTMSYKFQGTGEICRFRQVSGLGRFYYNNKYLSLFIV